MNKSGQDQKCSTELTDPVLTSQPLLNTMGSIETICKESKWTDSMHEWSVCLRRSITVEETLHGERLSEATREQNCCATAHVDKPREASSLKHFKAFETLIFPACHCVTLMVTEKSYSTSSAYEGSLLKNEFSRRNTLNSLSNMLLDMLGHWGGCSILKNKWGSVNATLR